MESILLKTKELSASIIENSVYTDYITAKIKLDEYPDTYKKIAEFKNKQMEDRFTEINTGSNSDFGHSKYLSKLYSDLLLDPVSKDFLVKEKKLLTLYEDIHRLLAENLEIDFFDFK